MELPKAYAAVNVGGVCSPVMSCILAAAACKVKEDLEAGSVEEKIALVTSQPH
jgi:hypothetical protein